MISGWWGEAVKNIETLLTNQSPTQMPIVEDIKYLKEVVMLFCHSVENLSLPTIKLKDCAFQMRHGYLAKLNDAYLRRFVIILWKDLYATIKISSPEKLKEMRKSFPIDHLASTKARHTVGSILPFSESVPKIYITLKEFVTELQSFCSGFHFCRDQVRNICISLLKGKPLFAGRYIQAILTY